MFLPSTIPYPLLMPDFLRTLTPIHPLNAAFSLDAVVLGLRLPTNNVGYCGLVSFSIALLESFSAVEMSKKKRNIV